MMKAQHLLLGGLGAALFGAGAYLARSSTSTAAPPAPVAQPAPARVAAPPPTLAPHRATTGLAADLHDADPRVRAAALAEAVRDGDADPAMLLAASRDPDPGVGLRATAALGKLYAQGAIPARELALRAQDTTLDPKVRTMAMNGLGGVPSDEASRLFTDLVARGEPLERRSAAIQLAQQDAAIAVPALIGALADADELVRANAAESLRRFARGRDFGTDANAWRSWWQARGS